MIGQILSPTCFEIRPIRSIPLIHFLLTSLSLPHLILSSLKNFIQFFFLHSFIPLSWPYCWTRNSPPQEEPYLSFARWKQVIAYLCQGSLYAELAAWWLFGINFELIAETVDCYYHHANKIWSVHTAQCIAFKKEIERINYQEKYLDKQEALNKEKDLWNVWFDSPIEIGHFVLKLMKCKQANAPKSKAVLSKVEQDHN